MDNQSHGSNKFPDLSETQRKWLLRITLLILLFVFLAFRIRNIKHLLPWDEAQLALIIRSYALGLSDQWAPLTSVHPPLFLWICSFLYKVLGSSVYYSEVVSLLFSTGTFLMVYFLSRELFGKKIAMLSAFFLAVMPASTVMDVWVKQDPAAVFFLVLTVFLFVKKKYAWGGIALGLGMLSKETAVFALMVIFLYSAFTWSAERLKGTIIIGAIGAAASFWWYVWASTTVGHFWGFFRGTVDEAIGFVRPWHYYFSGLPADIGWILLVLLIIGIAFSVYESVKGKSQYLLPVVWFLSVYLFLSLSIGKPYWMVPPGFPPIVMLAAIGLMKSVALITGLFKSGYRARVARSIVIISCVAACFFVGLFTGLSDYNYGKSERYWSQAKSTRSFAEYLTAHVDDGSFVYTIYDEENTNRDPILVYYLGDVGYVPLKSTVLDVPEFLVESARNEHAKWIYIKMSHTNPSYQERIDKFLIELGNSVRFDLKQATCGLIIELEI